MPSNLSLAEASRELVPIGDEASLRRDDTAAILVSLVDVLPPLVSSFSTLALPSESESCPKPPQRRLSSQHPAGSKSSSRAASHSSFNGIKSLHNLPAESCGERILCAARTVSDVLHLKYILALSNSSVAEAIGVTTGTWRAIALFTTAPSVATQKRMREWVAQKLVENVPLKLPPPGPHGIPVPPFACADSGYWPHLNELIKLIDDIKASFLNFPDRSAAVESLMTLTEISRRSVLNWFSLSTFPGRSHWSILQQWCVICGVHSLSTFEQRPNSVSLPDPNQQAFSFSPSEMHIPLKRAMPGGDIVIPQFKRPGTPIDPSKSRSDHTACTPHTISKSDASIFALPSPISDPKVIPSIKRGREPHDDGASTALRNRIRTDGLPTNSIVQVLNDQTDDNWYNRCCLITSVTFADSCQVYEDNRRCCA